MCRHILLKQKGAILPKGRPFVFCTNGAKIQPVGCCNGGMRGKEQPCGAPRENGAENMPAKRAKNGQKNDWADYWTDYWTDMKWQKMRVKTPP